MRGNTIKMSLSERKVVYPKDHEELYQYDYGQKLVLEGVALPTTYEVHFSNNEHGESVTQLGDSTGVNIPDMLLTTGQKIYVWVYLHNDSTDGETVYRGVIPVNERAKPTDAPPTPVQQSVVEEAIVALNDGVEQVEQAVANVGQDIQDALIEAKESGEFDGPKGDPGDNAYVYIRYSATEPSSDQDMKTEPDKWIGIYSGHADSAPTHYTDYTWYMFKGETVDISGKADKLDTVLDSTLSHGRKANTTVGSGSIAYGDDVEASGMYSQAFGLYSVASAISSHAEGRGTHATGAYSHAEGSGNIASGECSHVEGGGNTSSGVRSHAEGSDTTASGHYSHAEGGSAVASEEFSHAEGGGTKAQGYCSHAEGAGTKASGSSSHSEGGGTTASGNYSHSEGGGTTASGEYSHAEGSSSQSIGMASHAEGSSTKASGYSSHAEGAFTEASGNYSHVGGTNTKATRRSQTVFGEYNVYETGDTSTRGSYVEIVGNGAYNAHSNARALDWQGNEYLMGDVYVGCGISSTNGTKLAKLTDLPDISGKADKLNTVLESYLSRGRTANSTIGEASFAFGMYAVASGEASFSEGLANNAIGNYAHAGGNGSTASGRASFAFGGGGARATADSSFAIGQGTLASEAGSFVGGFGSTSSGFSSFVYGTACGAYDYYSVALGLGTRSEAYATTAFGIQTRAIGSSQTVFGMYNCVDDTIYKTYEEWVPGKKYVYGDLVKRTSGNVAKGYMCTYGNSSTTFNPSDWSSNVPSLYLEILGNGTADNARSNARATDWDGNEYLKGDVFVGCNADSTGGSKLAKLTDIPDVSGFYTKPSGGIPAADIASGVIPTYSTASTAGTVKVNPLFGTSMRDSPNEDTIMISKATADTIKAAQQNYQPIVPSTQHISAFYGLAKAAGDTTQGSSANAVGTYTTQAQNAIQTMLGVEAGVGYIETVSGTTPSITGQPNVRYICSAADVSTLSITPPSSGTIVVRFHSGTTATVLTVPNTVIFPDWIDITSLEASTTYEILITDGVYGSVMSWAD